MSSNHELILCACGTPEHQLILQFDSPMNPDMNELCIYYSLSPRPFFTRLRNAIAYIFGKRSRYDNFDNVLVEPEAVVPMIDFLERYLSEVETSPKG